MKNLIHSVHSFFTPHEGNNFRAKALHLSTLTSILILVLLMGAVIGKIKSSSGQVLGFATDITTNRLFELTNQKRSENGLGQLSYNDKLSQAAAAKAKHMFDNNYWAHYAPDGTAPWGFILGSGYEYSYAGENLAKNFTFSGDVVEAWMNSESHRHNLLRSEYADVGFAVVNGVLNGEETTLVVQMFGTPQAGKPQEQAQARPQTEVKSNSEPQPTAPANPTLAPTSQPLPTQGNEVGIAPSAVLARQSAQPTINLLPLYVNVNYVFMVIFALAIIVDFYLASKFHFMRITGKNIAHLIFVIIMLVGLTIVIKGSIL